MLATHASGAATGPAPCAEWTCPNRIPTDGYRHRYRAGEGRMEAA